MEKPNVYVLVLSIILYFTAVPLVAFGVSNLSVYIGFFSFEFFACMLIYKPRSQLFQIVSVALFFGWIITAALAAAGIQL